MKRLQSLKVAIFGALSGLVATGANAAVDTTAVITEIASNDTAIVAVGGALLALAAVAVGIKWLKATIFG